VYNRYLELKKQQKSGAIEVWGKELNKSATVSRNEEAQRPKSSSSSAMSSMGKKLLERTSFGTVCILRQYIFIILHFWLHTVHSLIIYVGVNVIRLLTRSPAVTEVPRKRAVS